MSLGRDSVITAESAESNQSILFWKGGHVVIRDLVASFGGEKENKPVTLGNI